MAAASSSLGCGEMATIFTRGYCRVYEQAVARAWTAACAAR
jgi:hypothetical protein